MILIVGGAHQGKREAARRLLGLTEEEFAAKAADGAACAPEELCGKPVLLSFQETVRKLLSEGKDPDAFARGILREAPELVTLDEVGCGIVPMERAQRDYREAVGRAGQLLAAGADEVYRVICGISQKIK